MNDEYLDWLDYHKAGGRMTFEDWLDMVAEQDEYDELWYDEEDNY